MFDSGEVQLTIIMTCYNQELYIRQAIDSVLMQNTSFAYRLLVVDDNSQLDNSRKIIKEYSDKYDCIEAILAEENGGYLVNVLRGKKVAKSKYLCLLDADDYYTDPYFLQKAYDFLENHDDYTIYEANVYRLEDDKLKPFVNSKIKSSSYEMKDVPFDKVQITQTTGQFFRNVIYSNGIPEPVTKAIGDRLAERSWEGDTTRFLMHLKWGKAYYSDQLVGIYRITPEGIWANMKKSSQFLYKARARMDYCEYFTDNKEYWMNKAWEYLNTAFKCKARELKKFEYSDWNETDRINMELVYTYCKGNRKLIMDEKLGLKKRIRLVYDIVFNNYKD